MDATSSIQSTLLTYFGKLGSDDQARVVDFARTLTKSPGRGTPGKELLRFAGTISREDAEAMLRAIEEGCEQVDANEW